MRWHRDRVVGRIAMARVSLAPVTVALALATLAAVAVSAVTVLAQEDAQRENAPGPTRVTGAIVESSFVDESTATWWTEDGVSHARGARLEHTFQWSDPRLPALQVTILDADIYEVPDSGQLWATSGSLSLEGAAGSWSGTMSGAIRPDGSTFWQEVLVGAGAYEGFFAMLDCDRPSDTTASVVVATCEGFILEGEPPPTPAGAGSGQVEPTTAPAGSPVS